MPRWFAFAALCFLVGCATPMPKDTPVVDAPDVLGDLPAQYVGTLPCADCDGIALWLTLGPRASYVLQQRVIGAEQESDYIEVGTWQIDDAERLALTPADSDETGTSLWSLTDDRLVALDENGQAITPVDDYTLTRRAQPISRSFADTDWFVVNAPDAHQGGRAYIRFGDEGRLTGSTGCNRIMGAYEHSDTMLTVSEPATTRKACPSFEDTEQSMLEALRQTRRARVLANYLLLFGPAGDRSPLALFQAESEAMPVAP